jgi:hypothetical protein
MNCMNQALRLAAFLGTTAFSAEANQPAVPPASLSSEVPVIVRDVGLEDGLFPLTLTLSLGEREQLSTHAKTNSGLSSVKACSSSWAESGV